MNPDTRQTIHVGINYVLAPTPVIDRESYLTFQKVLSLRGVDVSQTNFVEGSIQISRDAPTQFQIKVAAVPNSPVGHLLILAPGQWSGLKAIIKEIEAVVSAFDQTWGMHQRQIIASDASMRDLYETSAEHAFKELWETRLGQTEAALSQLGGAVLGGGLRFVIPNLGETPAHFNAEVKIESFLQDSSQIFVETQITWPTPLPPGSPLNPAEKLNQVNSYIETHLIPFITGASQ